MPCGRRSRYPVRLHAVLVRRYLMASHQAALVLREARRGDRLYRGLALTAAAFRRRTVRQ
jgi:hypothetical protein